MLVTRRATRADNLPRGKELAVHCSQVDDLRGNMKQIFVRRLELFAQCHRDPYNCATHYIAFPLLFLAVILPLEAFRIDFGQQQLPLGMVMTLPAIIAWILFDLGVGATLLLLICPLFIVAEFVVNQGVAPMLWTAGGLFAVGWFFQMLGHRVFERRRPAFRDDIRFMFIGPMFVAAKLLVWLGFRRDLAVLLYEELACTRLR